MPPRTNPFQQLIYLIEHQLAPHEATVTESKIFTDQVTGQPREVDISIETKISAHHFVIGIECIDWKDRADVTWIEQIASKHQDLVAINKTIAVARKGFSRPALIKAAQRKIDAFALSEAEASDWVTYTSRLTTLETMDIETPVAKCTEVKIQVLPPSSPPYPPPPTFISEEDTIIYDAIGNSIGDVKQVVNSVIDADLNFRAHIEAKATNGTNIPFDFTIYALDELYYVFDVSGTKHRLAQLVLKGECRLETSILSLDAANYGSASVLHGASEHMGRPMQVVWTERDDGQLMFGASIGEPGGDRP